MSVTAKDIEWYLTHGANALWPFRRYLVVANVSWGLLNWEADVVACSAAGYLTEIEIKISVADLRKDAEKNKHRRWTADEFIREFWYAMPSRVWEKVATNPPTPAYAGVLTLGDDGEFTRVREPTKKPARKLTDRERFQLARLGAMRYWCRMPTPELIRIRREKRAAEADETRRKWETGIIALGDS